jgi:septal ring factor EnvC (AmiA/AmiB activator)
MDMFVLDWRERCSAYRDLETENTLLISEQSDDRAVLLLMTRQLKDLEAEITRLHRVIARELTENDELGAEYTYVNALREELQAIKAERARVASGKVECADCGSLLARF